MKPGVRVESRETFKKVFDELHTFVDSFLKPAHGYEAYAD